MVVFCCENLVSICQKIYQDKYLLIRILLQKSSSASSLILLRRLSLFLVHSTVAVALCFGIR